MSKAILLTQGKSIYSAKHKTIWNLNPISYTRQIEQLVEKKQFQEAITLLSQFDSLPYDEKRARLVLIKTQQAENLFRIQHDFIQALSIYEELDIHPIDVIALFPPLIPDGWKLQAQSIEAPSLNSIEFANATHSLIRYLTNKRTQLYKKWNPDSELIISTNKSEDEQKHSDEPQTLAVLLDTALFKCYLASNHALVGPLVRVRNSCDPEEVEFLLREKGKMDELLDFFLTKGLYEKALIFLENEGDVERTFDFLLKLPESFAELIFNYTTWILQSNQSEGLNFFIHRSPIFLKSFDIVQHLDKVAQNLVNPYLEHRIF